MEALQSTAASPEFLLEDNSSHSFVSAPTSPNSCYSIAYFYSAPSSPTRGLTIVPSKSEAKSETQNRHMEIDVDTDDFEFETSTRFETLLEQHNHQHQEQREHVGDSPKMSFADELFSNGQVLPLKLPPRLQHFGDGRSSNMSSAVSSPRSPISVLKGPFPGISFKNKDFDPFTVALERVRKEGRGRNTAGLPRRRAQSLSPIRDHWANDPSRDVQHQDKVAGPTKFTEDHPRWYMRSTSVGRIEPTRLDATMSVNPPTNMSTMGTIGAHNKLSISVSSSRKRSKGQRIKDFLFRSASEGRVDPKDKLRDQTEALGRSSSLEHALVIHYSSMNDESKGLKKKTYLPYKPRLLACLGFGLNGAKNMNSMAHA